MIDHTLYNRMFKGSNDSEPIFKCGILYGNANLIRRIKGGLHCDDNFAEELKKAIINNQYMYEDPPGGGEYCYDCEQEQKVKPEAEKKTTSTGGNGTYIPEETSFFSNGNIKEKSVKPTENTSFEQGYKGIKIGKWKDAVEKARQYPYGSTDYKKAKEKIPYIIPHGKCSMRGNDYMQQHSGVFAGDVDPSTNPDLDFNKLLEALKANENVFFLFRSPGNGIKFFVKANTSIEKHKEHYSQFQDHFEALFSIKMDSKQGTLSQPCFVSHDPDAYFSKEKIPFPLLDKPAEGPTESEARNACEENNIEDAIGFCEWIIKHGRYAQSFSEGNRHRQVAAIPVKAPGYANLQLLLV